MQATPFDHLARGLGQAQTRRGALRLLGSALAVTALGWRGRGAGAAPAGSQQDLAEICRLAGGTPAPGLDGSLNCVFSDGWEIHCDASGHCTGHCWEHYGCNCRHADVCHHGESWQPPDDLVTAPDGVFVPADTFESGGGSGTPEDDSEDDADRRRSRKRKRRKERKRRRRGKHRH